MSTTRSTSELLANVKLCHAEMSFPCLHFCVLEFEGDAPASYGNDTVPIHKCLGREQYTYGIKVPLSHLIFKIK
jgi:hypothetical protein